jgi:hypothetical protein
MYYLFDANVALLPGCPVAYVDARHRGGVPPESQLGLVVLRQHPGRFHTNQFAFLKWKSFIIF